MSLPEPDQTKRDGSLPPGCKDLIDVMRLEPERAPISLPPVTRNVVLPRMVAVRYVAEVLDVDLLTLIVEMRELGIDISWYRSMSFYDAHRLLLRHGIWAVISK